MLLVQRAPEAGALDAELDPFVDQSAQALVVAQLLLDLGKLRLAHPTARYVRGVYRSEAARRPNVTMERYRRSGANA